MRKPVLVVGSVNLDLVASVSRLPVPGETVTGREFRTFFGGKGANQAVGVARLGHAVNLIAKVGEDDIGKRLLKGLREAGVGTKAVAVAKQTSSGVALIAADARGQNSIVVVPGANGKLGPRDVAKYESLIRDAGIILTQLETPLETLINVADLARRHKVPLMLDPAPARDLPPELLTQITWLTPNETEACLLCRVPSGTINSGNVAVYAEKLLERGPETVVIKMGAQGAHVATRNGKRIHIPAFRTQTVDSTAAGDAFNAGLAVALMRGKRMGEAMRFASAVAALSVTKEGAQASMPTARDVIRFLRHAEPGGGDREAPGESVLENAESLISG
jgi:ribokinase